MLIFHEDPPTIDAGDTTTTDTTGGDSSGSGSTGSGEGDTGVGSAFDDFPVADIVKIEEEWELTITDPDAAVSAPQVSTIMTPFEDADTLYLAFTVNHRVNNSFSPGGMELQLWYQGELLGWFTMANEVMGTANEKISWTQRLEVQSGKLRFSIVKGKSTTWGEFGQGESMHLEITTTLPDLNDYHPNVSIESSGITYGSNRVGTLVLNRVRGFDKVGTLVAEDADAVVVFGGSE